MPTNILYLSLDDAPYHMIPSMESVMRYLVREGLTFKNAYAIDPRCGPARASLFTGLCVHNHLITTNQAADPFKQKGLDADTVATRLSAAGYRTGHFGKYLNRYAGDCRYVPPGWDRWFTFCGGWNNAESFNISNKKEGWAEPEIQSISRSEWDESALIADRARAFIRNSGSPWLCWVDFSDPHGPYHPSPQDAHYADGATYHSPATEETDLSDKPSEVQVEALSRSDRAAEAQVHTEGKLKKLVPPDSAIGSFVSLLFELGQLESTLIVLTADHGFLLGEHGLLAKQQPYEESSRVPLILRGPGVARGVKPEGLASHIDVPATLLEVAGADTTGIDGRSLVPLFDGTVPDGWRKRLLIEHPSDDWYMLREGPYAYIERASGERELYNLDSDPYEVESLHGSSTQAGRIERFSEQLVALKGTSGDAFRAAEVS